MMKVCSKCMVEKPISEFHKKGMYKGKQYYYSHCKLCKADTDKKSFSNNAVARKEKIAIATANALQRNKEFVIKYLQNNPCVDCGEPDVVVLEFDHVRGKKLKAISRLVASHASLDTIQEEIDKCEVRCANCHRRITAKRAGWDLTKTID